MRGAAETASLVLHWVEHPVGTLPTGPLWRPAQLAAPAAGILGPLAAITRRACALLGTGNPAFGDQAPIGPGAMLLAAAIGGRHEPDTAARLIAAAGPAAGWQDAMARHAVVGAVLGRVGRQDLADGLLRASPLTAAFRYPPVGGTDDAGGPTGGEEAIERLLATRRGRDVLVAELATCSGDPRVLAWRARVLDQWVRRGQVDLALDVYARARLWHPQEWDAQVRKALGWHGQPTAEMKGTGDYWRHVSRVRLRAHRPLVSGIDDTVRLVNRYRRWDGGTR